MFCHFGLHKIEPGVQIFIEHWGEMICNFTPILPYFQHWGDEPRPRFFQVSKLSEEQKKKQVFTKNGNLFFPNSSTDLRSDAHQSQIIGGDADEDHTQIIGGIQSNYWGKYIPPIPTEFRHP